MNSKMFGLSGTTVAQGTRAHYMRVLMGGGSILTIQYKFAPFYVNDSVFRPFYVLQ
jgi:hypothetical protein